MTGQIYRIPADNPFVGERAARRDLGARPPQSRTAGASTASTGDLWIGDVGQDAVEEVDFEPASDPGGLNYGWDVMEGEACNLVDPPGAAAPPCNDPVAHPAHLRVPAHDGPATRAR